MEGELFTTLNSPSIEMVRGAAREAQLQHEALSRARDDELRRAERESARLEEEYLRVGTDQPLVKARLAGLWEQAQRRHVDLAQRHRLCPLAPPVSLDERESAELARLLENLHVLWRHRHVTSQQRKVIVHLLIKAIYVTPGPEVWKLEIVWAGGARSQHEVLTGAGITALVERGHVSGQSVTEIREDLAVRGAVVGVSIQNTEALGIKAVQQLARRAHHSHRFNEKAYSLIHQRVLEGTSHQLVADQLNALAIPHYRGRWTITLVRSAVYRMRRTALCGLSRLPGPRQVAEQVATLHDCGLDNSQIADRLREAGIRTTFGREVALGTIQSILRRLGRVAAPYPRRPPGRTPLDAMLRRLWEETPSVADVTHRANEQRVHTSRGNPWRSSGIARTLDALSIRTPAKRADGQPRRKSGRPPGTGKKSQLVNAAQPEETR